MMQDEEEGRIHYILINDSPDHVDPGIDLHNFNLRMP
jgi:hypothetical protein